MEIRDLASLAGSAQSLGSGASVTPLYPSSAWGQGLVAVDLWEIEPGGSLASHAHPEEHVLFVLSGQGRITGEGQDGPVAAVREHTVIYLGPNEAHQIRNTGSAPLRLLVSTPLLVRSNRAHGASPASGASAPVETPARSEQAAQRASSRIAERSPRTEEETPPPAEVPEPEKPSAPTEQPAREEETRPPASIGGLRRASELKDQPKPERRKPAPPPEETPPVEEQAQPEEEVEEQSNLMELFVAFSGGTRGSSAQGFGRYLVQAPGRKPVVKVAEFGTGYTPALALYDALIECLRYIGSRLEVTGRTPEQVQLDIRSDNESVVNGLLGTMKVREPALKKRQEQALELLGTYADWRIEWHSPEESTKLLG